MGDSQPLHIVFLHLDLGIGGAEQLIVNLALASLPKACTSSNNTSERQQGSNDFNATVTILTTHCDSSHCFDAVRPPDGVLSRSVHVVGAFLPEKLFGKYGTALCSTIRMLYLSAYASFVFPKADLYVLDVLPTSIPYLVHWRGVQSVLFYCHFPDKLLTRNTVNGVSKSWSTNKRTHPVQRLLHDFYRKTLDWIEEWSMSYADLICVNSNFTCTEVLRVFPSLSSTSRRLHKTEDAENVIKSDSFIQVLHPAIDLQKFIVPDTELKLRKIRTMSAPIVSLNRFERKKNIELLLKSYSRLLEKVQENHDSPQLTIPPLIIAGGYDPRNDENIQYLEELRGISEELRISHCTSFRPSISDEERATLLQSALCLVYTPFREHFGIVPLEAMYAGTAVIAIKSGGPMETVIDEESGILLPVDEKTSDDELIRLLSQALLRLISNPEMALNMGTLGHLHVKENFGLDQFRIKWIRIIDHVIRRGRIRKACGATVSSSICYFFIFSFSVAVIFRERLTNVFLTSP